MADASVRGEAATGIDASVSLDAAFSVVADAQPDSASELPDLFELCAQHDVRADPVTGQLPCTLELPGLSLEELRFVNVAFTPQPDAPEQFLLRAVDPSKCGDHENAYFFVGEDPAALRACPATCALWQASPSGRVSVVLACIGPVIE